jgi:uncharacterized protein (TIGR00255 family)
MTGFGKATNSNGNQKIQIEIKALNSKQLDLNLKLPAAFKALEYEWRNIISQKLQRGKVELLLTYDDSYEKVAGQIDPKLAAFHISQIKQLADSLDFDPPADMASYLLKVPGIFTTNEIEANDELRLLASSCLSEAINSFDQFRQNEGKVLEKDLSARISLILSLLTEIEKFESERLETVKQRLIKNLNEFAVSTKYDENRLEQELIYYLEKFDITEEKVRLKQHCEYFLQTLAEDQAGKKLGFISQEIGREINTLGSKANHAGIQRLVVQMKDELEKIKEQLYNIL